MESKTVTMNERVVIRPMNMADVAAVCALEEVSFSLPWPADAFERELTLNEHAHYYVLETAGGVVAYCGMWVVFDQVQITNIAVLPEVRGCGFGSRLFSFMIEKARELGGTALSLEVRVSNTKAMGMYKKFGLQPGGIRKGYYADNQEDALVMWVNLS